jgi:predicted phosphoribosyltransferase
MFRNREEAGKKLAEKLLKYKKDKPIIFAIPRGGVVVAYEVAKKLKADLDIIIPRKIGAPYEPELAIGAVTEDGTIILNEDLVKELGISKEYIKEEASRQIEEIKRRMKFYRKGKEHKDVKNRSIIIIDDGIATGATMKAAVISLKKKHPKKIIIAVPVAPVDSINEMKKIADEVICLEEHKIFGAIGNFYHDFRQVEDEEVINLLKKYL